MSSDMTETYPPRRFGVARAKSDGPFQSDRERINRAREAAEALFRPKRQDIRPSVSDSRLSAESSERKPRILTTSPTVPVRHAKPEALDNTEPPMPPAIPASHFARIRAWLKYGMTIPQVAQVYGVAVREIERILRKT
jgi:hypothetical protein